MKTILLTLLCGLACASGHASILYFGGPSFPVPLDFTQVEPLDLDQNGAVDFNFTSGPSLTGGSETGADTPVYVSSVSGNAVLTGAGNSIVFPAGALIGSNVTGTAWST